jgi:nucleoside-diphosphate-sugar epimerase
MSILVVGATGNIGRGVVEQLLAREVSVVVLVRGKFPANWNSEKKITVIKRGILDISPEDLAGYLKEYSVSAVVSCLGHVPDFNGICCPPRRLVLNGNEKVCDAIQLLGQPVHFVSLATVGISDPNGSDPPRACWEAAILKFMAWTLFPLIDSSLQVNYLVKKVGKRVPWVIVRPSHFNDGPVSTDYELHEHLVCGAFDPAAPSTKANISHFICELVTNQTAWSKWQWKLPVILDKRNSKSKSQ